MFYFFLFYLQIYKIYNFHIKNKYADVWKQVFICDSETHNRGYARQIQMQINAKG